MRWLCLSFFCSILFASEPAVISHEDLREFAMNGNLLKGLATKMMGAQEFEVWHSSIAVGSKTPRHVHESEEIFIILKGEMLAIIGEKELLCKAPATLICPANIPHQLINIGECPTDHFLVLRVDSKICDEEGHEMLLPWRN